MKRVALVASAAYALVTVPAAAESPPPITARLEYDGSGGGPTCPEVSFFRNIVAAHFGGRDPFTAEAPKRITLTIRRRGRSAFVASAEMFNEAGDSLGTRELVAADCTGVVDAMGVTMTYWLRPLLLQAPPPPEPPGPSGPPAPPPPAPIALTPTVRGPPTLALAWRPTAVLGLGPHLSFGTLPGPVAPGFAVGVGVRWPMLSLGVDVAAEAPTSAGAEPPRAGRVRVSRIFGSVVPCIHVRWFIGCAVLSAGALAGEGDGVVLPHPRSAHVAAGARAGGEVQLAPRLAIRLAGEVLSPFTRPAITFARDSAWCPPPLGGSLSARVVTSF